MPKEDRIIVKGMHTPIVDEETFNIVQDMIKSRTATRVKSYDWLLKGLVCCKYSNLANTSKDKIIKNKYNIKNEILILEKKIKDINKKIDKLFEDKYSGLFEEEDFTRIYARQIETRKDTEERIKQLKAMEEKEDSSVDINELVKDFVNMKEITRTMLVSLVDKIEISENKEITIYYKFNILNMRKLENRLENVS